MIQNFFVSFLLASFSGTGKFCQKLLFLHQLTHNITNDCSLFIKIVSSEYLQNMLCTQIAIFVLFLHSEQFWYTISWRNGEDPDKYINYILSFR
jgi:hypothetical protein